MYNDCACNLTIIQSAIYTHLLHQIWIILPDTYFINTLFPFVMLISSLQDLGG